MTYAQLMQPSDAFVQLGRMPRRTSPADMLQRVIDFAAASIPGVSEASVTVVQGADAYTAAGTGGLAPALDEAQYAVGEGPCLQAARTTTIGYAGFAMARDHLDDAEAILLRHVDASLDGEAVIEQAKGIIMGKQRCTPGEAFAALTAMAHDSNRTVREVARALGKRTAETAGP